MPLYGIIAQVKREENETVWAFLGPGPNPQQNSDLVKLLNNLGQQGWEVVGVGNFGSIGGSQTDEIILKK